MGRTDGYAPIEDYAAIGNGETVALVARDGSIDWLPLPRLDSQTVFARILDPERGGAFELAPEGAFEVERRYRGDSNVLETTFTTTGGVVRVTDAITLDNGGLLPWFELARRVEGVSGRVPMRWRIAPRLGAGEDEEEVTIIRVRDAVVAKTRERYLAVQAFDAGDLNHTTNTIGGAFETHEASRALLVLRSAHDEPIPFPRRDWVERRVDGTADDWQRWLADAGVDGEWRDATRRSALVLRLLTYVPSGGVAAAATTSLPEAIGGDRNYDYRYGWVRDTAYTLDALLNLGLLVQVHASLTWLLDAIARTSPKVSVFYDLDGETTSGEKIVELAGYRGSRPVRRGNEAAGQRQLGSYGDLLETAELYVRDGNSLDNATRARLTSAIDHLVSIRDDKDSGIWELPDEQHYTSSKLAAWTALDRALRLVDHGELPDGDADAWRDARRELREFVEYECWSDERRAYVMYPGTTKLDASVLRIVRMGFLEGSAERLHSTIDAVRDELSVDGGPLVYRYSGQEDVEGAFVACSFWLVEALARAGRLDEATETMRAVVACANDVGLFAEEADARTGEFLGNFPQGLSHLALITAAAAIAEQSS
ncbi:MAG: glycoside hydrolase family 15 protein [Gaiellaceae bacterium]